MTPCKHMIRNRAQLMEGINDGTLEYSDLPDINFMHHCSQCNVYCKEFDLHQEMKRLFD